jgi:hypothetical protein
MKVMYIFEHSIFAISNMLPNVYVKQNRYKLLLKPHWDLNLLFHIKDKNYSLTARFNQFTDIHSELH